MNTTGNNPSSQRAQPGSSNPLARAMAESSQRAGSQDLQAGGIDQDNPFGETMAQAGDHLPTGLAEQLRDPQALQRQQQELERQQKWEAQRRKLHKEVNPLDATDVFSAREKQVKREIDELRQELKLLVKEVSQFNTDVGIAVTQDVVNPGQTGAYHLTFFQKLKSFIMQLRKRVELLRQQVKNAGTWRGHSQNLVNKKRSRRGPTLGLEGKANKKTHDFMHHEMSQATSAG